MVQHVLRSFTRISVAANVRPTVGLDLVMTCPHTLASQPQRASLKTVRKLARLLTVSLRRPRKTATFHLQNERASMLVLLTVGNDQMKLTRKSTDGQGVIIWWYDNGWRIVRSPDRPHAYHVETSNHFTTYRNAGTWTQLKVARHILKCQDNVAA